MKIKYTLLILATALSFGLTGCSDDDEKVEITEPAVEPVLTVDKEDVLIIKDVSDVTTVQITEGAGDYDVYSLNEKIATAEISATTVQIKAIEGGNTNIILSDKNGGLKRIGVTVEYEKLTFEKSEFIVEFPKGNKGWTKIPVKTGNGGYIAVSDNETIAIASADNDGKSIRINIMGIEDGKANITVTDALGLETVISVITKGTREPYNEAQLAEIMKITGEVMVYNDREKYAYASYTSGIENSMNMYGWDYYSWYIVKVYFSGDHTVGNKPGSKITNTYASPTVTNGNLDIFRIIKNDGKKIWAVFSYINNDIVYPGYLVMDIIK